MEPVIKPLGFDWKIGTALIGATMAKEVFVSQLSIVYSLGGSEEEENIHLLEERCEPITPRFRAFALCCSACSVRPCIATIAVTRKESGAWKWALLQFFGLAVMAYVVTLAVYQTGRLIQSLL